MSTKAEIQQRLKDDTHTGCIIQIGGEFFILDLFEFRGKPLSLCMQVESDQIAYFETWEEQRDFRTVSWAVNGTELHQVLLVRPTEVSRRHQKVVLRCGTYKVTST